MPARYTIDKELITKMAMLQIEVIDGEKLNPPILSINAHGLSNIEGLRNVIDGQVVFGSKKYCDKNPQEVLNDYIIDDSAFGAQHFCLSYEHNLNRY